MITKDEFLEDMTDNILPGTHWQKEKPPFQEGAERRFYEIGGQMPKRRWEGVQRELGAKP
ncbi:MAG: hypothetical protein H6658_02135 [Ardenticatenaceae bacterium]|nr:hypothetical protein [Ardenticatenaceae bacterium]